MEDKFDLIEKYLMNELSVREQVKFEEELRSDPELMKEFQLRKGINSAILEDDEVSDLRDLLHDVMEDELPKRSPKKLYLYSALAAVIILLIVIGKLFLPDHSLTNQQAFRSYYSVYPPVSNFRSQADQSEMEKTLYKAFNHYSDGEYTQGAKHFKQVIEEDNTNYMGQFYLALCKIETNELEEAEEYLLDLVSRNNHIFWEQSYWYLALLYLKNNEKEKAITTLNEIVQENMTKKSEAQEMLKSLK